MEPQLVLDGVASSIDDAEAVNVAEVVSKATSGDILVALSYSEGVFLSWIDEAAKAAILSVVAAKNKVVDAKKKAAKKDLYWLHEHVSKEFDHAIVEHQEQVRDEYERVCNDVLSSCERPESYRRWLMRLKKKWVRRVISQGRMTSPTS